MYPSSKLAGMDDAELLGTGALWADALIEVPVERIEWLFRRFVRTRTDRFVPGFAEFRTVWDAETRARYWHDDPQSQAQRALMPPAEPETDSGQTGLKWQMKRMKAGLGMVTCQCVNSWGNHNAAELSHDKTQWVCKDDRCDFCDAVDTAFFAPTATTNTSSEGMDPLLEPSTKGPTLLERAADACEIELEKLDVLTLARFSGFVLHWNASYECALTRQYFDEWYPQWLNEQIERIPATLRSGSPTRQAQEVAA